MSETSGRVLVVDDKQDVLAAIRLLLQAHVEAVHTARDPAALPALLQEEDYDVILLDMNFTQDASSGREGFHWLSRILQVDPAAVVILITAYGDVEKAVRAMKEGATDFIPKPWKNEKLLATVRAAVELRRSRREADRQRLRQERLGEDLDQPFRELVGRSAAMQGVFRTIEKVAATEADVLILGENGTGKELVARALHRHSKRADEIFVSVDLGALPETLFESELFGHVRGAFTGAGEDRPGRFEIASGGTLFLDEIGNIPPPLQAKLLTVLQRREVTPVGAVRPRPVDVRLVSATNRPVHEMVQAGTFRQDLLYRINTVEIHLPPLRERPDDVPLLAGHFMETYARKYGKAVRGISDAALERLKAYPWPGNVRELQHALERAVILSEADVLGEADFMLALPEGASAQEDAALEGLNLQTLEEVAVRRALRMHGGNISRAAEALGISRKGLYRRIQKHRL